jgi:V8-like Glu-specific endopeptidase
LIQFPGAQPLGGTGWFVGAKLVITAGHCVFDRTSKSRAEITVIPACALEIHPYGTFQAADVAWIEEWANSASDDLDLGAILLDDDVGTKVGSFGVHVASDADLGGASLRMSGYPRSRTDGSQWSLDSTTLDFTGHSIDFRGAVSGGDSGSPVWLTETGQVVGVMARESAVGIGTAVRITDTLLNVIKNWNP